jgi:hypothetical protein
LTILRIVSRGLDRKTYDTMRGMMDIDRKHPLGLIMHGVSEKDGVMQVAQIWDSEEYAQRFDEDLLAPVLQAVGAPLDAEVASFELEDLVTP